LGAFVYLAKLGTDEVVAKPFDVIHQPDELGELADYINSLEGESRIVLEHTGKYSESIANFLHREGIFVCVVNAKLIHVSTW